MLCVFELGLFRTSWIHLTKRPNSFYKNVTQMLQYSLLLHNKISGGFHGTVMTTPFLICLKKFES